MADKLKMTSEHAKLIAQGIQRYADWEAGMAKQGLQQTTSDKVTWCRPKRFEITSPAHARTPADI